MSLDVKYQVAPMMARSIVVQLYVPICYAALQDQHRERLDVACREARDLLESARDHVAAELQISGVCPYCNDPLHPEGERCAG